MRSGRPQHFDIETAFRISSHKMLRCQISEHPGETVIREVCRVTHINRHNASTRLKVVLLKQLRRYILNYRYNYAVSQIPTEGFSS